MKYAMRVSPDGKSEMVSADGKPLGKGDATQRVLHVVPKLFVPPGAAADLNKDTMEINITSTVGIDLTPAGGIIVRQPYPNQRYYVGGSHDIRNGWIVPIPDNVDHFDIEITWTIFGSWRVTNSDDWSVRHLMHVTLEPGEGNTYTMDASCWPSRVVDGPNRRLAPISQLGVESDSADMLMGRDILRRSALAYPDDPHFAVGHYIEENVAIPGIKLDQAWSIDAFQDEQLHEVQQQVEFAQGNDHHERNARIEFPAKVFVSAVKLARNVPYAKGSQFRQSIKGMRGGCERHPALKLIADWWTEHRPEKTAHKVGFAMPWVRVRDDNEYWCGYYETPNMPLEAFASDASAQARIGSFMLLMFQAAHEHYTADEDGIHTFLANGTPYMTIGLYEEDLNSGACDESWYALEAYARFPERFPAAWSMLKKMAKLEDVQNITEKL